LGVLQRLGFWGKQQPEAWRGWGKGYKCHEEVTLTFFLYNQ